MTPKLPVVKAQAVEKIATRLGFKFDRKSGSHSIYYRSEDKRRVVIPIHKGKDIKKKTLKGIIKDMGIDVEEFIKILKL